MSATILTLIIALGIQPSSLQAQRADSAAVESHIQDIVRELPSDSNLREELLQGARGSGVHQPWMDVMQEQGIKRAVVWIDIRFDSKGRPKKLDVNRAEYYTRYDGGSPISDKEHLESIRESHLEQQLDSVALEKARHGGWVDVPHPKPHPFVGGTQIEFLSDEWLPAQGRPLYYAR